MLQVLFFYNKNFLQDSLQSDQASIRLIFNNIFTDAYTYKEAGDPQPYEKLKNVIK